MWWGNHTSRNIDIEAGVKMAWTGLNLTNDGRRILNKAQLNNRLNFKSIVIGDGNAPANFNAQKKLVHQLYELTDLKISIEDDVCILMTDLPVVDYDYYLREIGVIVTTDDGDKLYAYDNCGGDAQYVINTAGIERTEKRVRLALTVSGVENITVSVPSNLYVDYKDYENTIADIRQSKIDGAGGDISDTVSSFKQTDILENIKSGEKTGQIFGKVSKAINVLISHLADNVRHITAGERSLWNTVKNKVDIIPGKGLSTNDYTTVEKNKLSGIADKANNYVHPVSHPADIITQDATHRFVSDDEKKVWNTNKSNVDTHVSNNTIHITSQERTKWNKVTDKLDKTGGAISGDIVPDKTEAYDLGHEDKKWDNVWVETLEAGYVNAKEGIRGNLTGNASTATKLATTRNINGIKFDGTSDIQLPLYYSHSFGVTQNAIYYSSFCKMKKDNITSECETTLLLSATGNFGGTIPGTYLISMSNRGQKATMTVVCLQKSSQSDLTFGYFSDDTYFYFGVIRPTYSYSTNLTVLSKSASAETGKFLNSTTKPKSWVDVKITNSIGGNASTVNGYTVEADVPANAKFTDTNTWIAFKGATTSAAGTAGYAPAPAAGAANRYLRSDGTWSVPPDNNTTYSLATQSMNGLQSAADKKKLDGIAAGANAYIHPTSAGNKHIPSGGSSGQILRWSADGTAVWGSDNNSKASYTTKTTSGNNIKGTYRCIVLSDGSTKILCGATTLTAININQAYGNAYWRDAYIDIPSYFYNGNSICSINITPHIYATGLLNVQIIGYTTSYIAVRVFSPKAETISCTFMVCMMGY